MSPCKTCEKPLVIRLDDDSDDEGIHEGTSPSPDIIPAEAETVPDDLELRCGCHFHWECLMENASQVASSLQCPSCHSYLPINAAEASSTSQLRETSSKAAILAQYRNEGGVQNDLNIMDSLAEEAYIQNHPETRPARAFHVMCSEGDVAGVIDLLQDVSGQGHDVAGIIRYQDPLHDMKSGLHLSVENQQMPMVWTLLWLSSTLPTESFPDLFRQSVGGSGLGRLTVQPEEDIRGLTDCQGRTAQRLAEQNPGRLAALLEAGILSL
ncbi:hypothetical protein E4U41_002315 [Claviceps citrina]|nr:hypothetical protein E4U41_002315 [Claviceps citrina]